MVMEGRYRGHLKVSVVITCYNHGKFLADAIQSVQRQTYEHIEIVIIDDGSTDNTAQVAKLFPDVKYVFQQNAGLSAARNKGIDESTGSYLVFLDADDWLYDDAIETNIGILRKNRNCIFVSGGHQKVDESGTWLENDDEILLPAECSHYEQLLKGNYIGMHGAVMYHRMVFNENRFDTKLKACEDYDLYLRISRTYPVCHHSKKIAAYRFHRSNMSVDMTLMLNHVLKVLEKQKPLLRNDTEKVAFRLGRQTWKEYYSSKLFEREWAASESGWPSIAEVMLLGANKPRKLGALFVKKVGVKARQFFRSKLPVTALRTLHRRGVIKNYSPAVGEIDFGDFNRPQPFSNDFGYDRGGPIDRFYIEQFLSLNTGHIKGNVLEVGDNEYTLRFGNAGVIQSDILHVDASNTKATYVGDITNSPQIPSDLFDCIIFTQTLHLIYDFKSALKTCYRILKPGGCLLLTVPGITPIDRGQWKDYWLWSFTDTAMKKVMTETFNGSEVDIKTYGNVFVASGFLYGVGLNEIPREALNTNDPAYQVIVSVKAIKH